MKATAPTPSVRSDCNVLFGGRAAGVDLAAGRPALRVAVPVLAGDKAERLMAAAGAQVNRRDYFLFQRGPWLAGFSVAAPGPDLETATGELYRRLFGATAGLHIYRIWNYVPRINSVTRGMENYHRFCRGRSLAFEEHFGKSFHRILPAASAVGSAAGPLAIGFLAGRAAPQHFENPGQVPAFDYPRKYGPRPPSFSRATAVTVGKVRRIFISGTAAVRGHASVGGGDLGGQLDCTLGNLAEIGKAAGAGPTLGGPTGWRRAFKVYLRRPADLRLVQARLDRDLLAGGGTVSYLRSDICRAELLVEIEATLENRL